MNANITNKDDNISYGFEKSTTITLSEKFKIDPKTQKVRIEGEFKGIEGKDTYFHFGIACYKGDRIINAPMVMRNSLPCTVKSVIKEGNMAYKRLVVICDETEDKSLNWNINSNNTREFDYSYSLGFYFDGNISKLPDFLMSYRSTKYSKEIDYGAIRENDNHSITLNLEIPENIRNHIKEGTTKVIRHTSGGTYLYSAACNYKLGPNWEKKVGEIQGIAKLGRREDNKFWTDTDSFVVMSLVNCKNSSEGSETFAKNIKCEIIPI